MDQTAKPPNLRLTKNANQPQAKDQPTAQQPFLVEVVPSVEAPTVEWEEPLHILQSH